MFLCITYLNSFMESKAEKSAQKGKRYTHKQTLLLFSLVKPCLMIFFFLSQSTVV